MPIVRTAEATCVGHPDKLCDLIADRVLDDILWEDKCARVAVEVLAAGRTITVAGEITITSRPCIRDSCATGCDKQCVVAGHTSFMNMRNENPESVHQAIVIAVIEGGMSTAEAAKQFGLSQRWIRSLVRKARVEGIESIWDRLNEPKPHPTTIYRILRGANRIEPNPKKRPKRSYIRFQAALPNETWQSDFTHITPNVVTQVA